MLTFVTAFVNIDEARTDRGLEMRLKMFQKLTETGIRLHVFVSPEYVNVIRVPNGCLESVDISTFQAFMHAPDGISAHRNPEKDTPDYMKLMNCKLEFVYRAMQSGDSTHYAWIDFSVYQCLQDPDASTQLHAIQAFAFPQTCLYFPGCWNPMVAWDRINWRFCGGFFLGDKISILELFDHFVAVYPTLPNLTWEVNVWAYLESRGHRMDWYNGDHSNRLLDVPMATLVEVSDPKILDAVSCPPLPVSSS